jgi:hypothetical protein
MALVGSLLLGWGWLEEALRDAPIPDDLERVRRLRNAPYHRMVAAHADPEGDGTAWVDCRLSDGTPARYSAADLEEASGIWNRKPITTLSADLGR